MSTHAFLWWAEDSPRLSKKARAVFADGRTRLLWSVARTWDLADSAVASLFARYALFRARATESDVHALDQFADRDELDAWLEVE